MMTATTSAELVAAAKTDPLAWNTLVQRYGRMICFVARTHRLSEADTADVCQTVWLRLFEHVDQLKDPDRLGAWLKTTARNEALRVARLKARTTLTSDMTCFDIVDAASQRQSEVEAAACNQVVREALEALPMNQQTLLSHLMSEASPSYDEISMELGIPIGSIGPTRSRSLRSLRRKCLPLL